ncbi:hypothetical protein ACIGW1_12520 [Streptomyces sp. NPDC053780]|uniref:hypothetical protein n=1 Tax=unclassified Streptomyces TaxID=2593676 RepID=UPI000F747435|nr:hypothetical protein [Streptomyces sp. WAC 04229]RSN64427.1 hypothetical protein DMH12_02855 [Streptomyces sp. WAC 04229]
MRKIPAAAAVAVFAGISLLGPVPGASAAAAATCADNYESARAGYMYAYNGANCEGQLGLAVGNDQDWGDSASSFQGSDDNRASSVLNMGRYSEVKFFAFRTSFSGFNPHICLTRAEGYASNLSDDYFMEDPIFGSANNSISAHIWVDRTSCSAYAV